jgi:hypothetical protein
MAELSVEAAALRVGRLALRDGRLATTAGDLGILRATIPGALTLTTPAMSVLANNRSLAPVTGYDVQLYPKDRPFFLNVNGSRLSTDAFIIQADSDVAQLSSSFGSSMARDLARLGTLFPSAPAFGETARRFVLGEDGRWRGVSGDPETTASIGGTSGPRVNLGGAEGQP